VPGYDDWVSKELHTEATRLLTRAELAAVHRVIMTGHPSELESVGRYFADHYDRHDSDGAGGPSEKPYVFNVLVPRPPALPENAPVVREPSASSSASPLVPVDPTQLRLRRPALPAGERIPHIDLRSVG
jgi:hypothetical protein